MIANPNITSQQQVKPADGELLLWAVDQRDARTLGPGLLNDATNLRFNDGVPTTRKGTMKPAWANYTSPSNILIGSLGTPYGAGIFRDPNGVEWQIVAAGGYVWRTRPGNANVAIPLPAGVTMVNPCRFVQAFNLLFCFRGRYLAPLVLSDLNAGFTDLLPQFNAATGGSIGGGVYQAAVVATGTAADQMAYGPYQAVSSLTWTGGTATCATVLQHGYISGADVTVKGAVAAALNGRVPITVLDAYTFTYPIPSSQTLAPAGTDAGTVLVTNNAYYWTAAGSTVNVTSLTTGNRVLALTSLTCPGQFTVSGVSAGPNVISIVSLIWAASVVTATTPSPHGLTTGEQVSVAGASVGAYNGTFVATVTGATTFTYALAGNPGSQLPAASGVTGTAPYGLLATVTAAGHGLVTGQQVTMAGATGTGASSFNGTFGVTVLSTSQFTYNMTASPGTATATGTITCLPSNYLVATATAAGHGLLTGQQVQIQGAVQTAFNGSYTVTVISSSQFQYTMATAPSANVATGPLTATLNVGTTALATAAAHGFATGDYVTITGAAVAAFNGTWPIVVTGGNTFTFALATNPGPNTAGVVTAQTSKVLAGQTPDSNPNAWTRCYNILPNAETALFIQNLLLVPTAYQPSSTSSTNNYATITGGAYSTVDFIVATNYQDYLHFTFNNELRINQGTADEIVDLFAFGPGNVVILKGKSWAMLTGLNTGNIANVALQFMSKEYGAAGPRCWAVVGGNAYFLSPTYGVVVIRTTDLGTTLSVNVPLSAPIQWTINQIDWTQANKCRMSQWDNKLYLAVPLKNGQRVILIYDFKASVRMGNNVWESGVMTQGWTPMDTGAALAVQEFFRMTLNGTERHLFLDTSGFVNLLEEHDGPDQLPSVSGIQGLGWGEIQTYALSRAYGTSVKGSPWPTEMAFSLATFNPNYSLAVEFPGENNAVVVAANVTRSNTKYDRPWTALPWNPTNSNNDWSNPWRQDYSVVLPNTNLLPAGAAYQYPLYEYFGNLVPGQSYVYQPGPNDGALINGLQTIVSGSFVASAAGYTLYGINTLDYLHSMANEPVTAFLGYGLFIGSGIVLDQFQEMLDTRYVGTRRGKDFQLSITNTQGRIKLVGMRVDSSPGASTTGPQL